MGRKNNRGPKRRVIKFSEGFYQKLKEDKQKIKKEKGIEPSFEEIILSNSDYEEEEIEVEEEKQSFMDLF